MLGVYELTDRRVSPANDRYTLKQESQTLAAADSAGSIGRLRTDNNAAVLDD
jgi:hypothetical protein